MTYAILNKDTGSYFAGFDSDGAVLWGPASDAWQNRRDVAEGQARLLICCGANVQKKPVSL